MIKGKGNGDGNGDSDGDGDEKPDIEGKMQRQATT